MKKRKSFKICNVNFFIFVNFYQVGLFNEIWLFIIFIAFFFIIYYNEIIIIGGVLL